MNEKTIILVVNPGSTSTRTAIYDGEMFIKEITLEHEREDLDKCGKSIIDQLGFRTEAVRDFLKAMKTSVSSLSCIMARGGLLRPVAGGTYRVNKKMIEDLQNCTWGRHASNLGALIGAELAGDTGVPVYIADPVVVDELSPLARYSGHPLIERRSIFHALNQKAVCRKMAADTGKKVEEAVFIIAHLGGGISIGIHVNGKVADVTNALDGEGPFTPERCGSLPALSFYRYAADRKMSMEEAESFINRHGGLFAYLGTNSFKEVEERAILDESVMEIAEAMGYQISKEIYSLAAFSLGNVDGIALTGGLAGSKLLTGIINRRVKKLAPVFLYPQSSEMDALAARGLEIINGNAEAGEYPG